MRSLAVLLLATIASASVAAAQCPDGSVPPCERRRDRPLDAKRWIVFPFQTVSPDTGAHWLRDASANLLYLELAKWREVGVVDDERVADRIRIAGVSPNQVPLDLSLIIARRFGARNMVIGDLLQTGRTTSVLAKVYDVASGRRTRTFVRELNSPDSLSQIFRRLAADILGVPASRAPHALGTLSLSAYRSYLDATRQLQRFEIDSARAQLRSSLAADSTFALAHYKLALIATLSPEEDLEVLAAAQKSLRTAARHAGMLPARERSLIRALSDLIGRDFRAACSAYASLVATDSTDAEAWYGLGRCQMDDHAVETTSESPARFRGDWNLAITAFRRVLQLDPSNHLAFEHIVRMLSQELRFACTGGLLPNGYCDPNASYVAIPRHGGDSVEWRPLLITDSMAYAAHRESAARSGSVRRNLEMAARVAEEWLEADPRQARARAEFAQRLVSLGRLWAADSVIGGSPQVEAQVDALTRIALYVGRGRPDRARALIDSLPPKWSGVAGHLDVMFGRFARFDSALAADTMSGVRRRYARTAARATLGLADSSIVIAELAMLSDQPQQPDRALAVAPTMAFALALPRSDWGGVGDARTPQLAAAAAIAHRDTVALHAAARLLDSIARLPAAPPHLHVSPDGSWAWAEFTTFDADLLAADAYLMLGDSLAALQRVRRTLDSTLVAVPLVANLSVPNAAIAAWLWPRAMLRRTTLAAALGFSDEARFWYRRLADLWAQADPDLQEAVNGLRQILPQ